MSTELQTALRTEAERLTKKLAAIHTLLGEIGDGQEPTAERKKNGKRPRTSSEEVEGVLAEILSELAQHPKGLRSEGLQERVQKDKKLIVKAIKLGLTSDQIEKKGDRRATTYLLPSAGSAAQASGRVVRRKKT